jgi:citrate synthase
MTRYELTPPARRIGQYVESGDWSDYWRTAISVAHDGRILVRGYPVEEIIERLSSTEAHWLLLKGELPTGRQAAIFDACLRSGMDQQFISSAASATRFAASASRSPVSAVAAGMLATGTVTGSPRPTMEMLYAAAERRAREERSRERIAAAIVAEHRERHELVPGFGHPLHRDGVEPRAEALRRVVERHRGWGEHGLILDALRDALRETLGRTVTINLAGMLAAVYCDLDFDPLVAEGVSAIEYGWALVAHAVEEIRDGVPLRIIPDALGAAYTGPSERHIPDPGGGSRTHRQ